MRAERKLPLTATRSPLVDGATSLIRELNAAGHEALMAGGVVRDLILGRVPHDADIATSARPEEITAVFPDARFIGKAFGVSQVTRGDISYEIATFREDLGYDDGRRPSAVRFTDAEHDALRRDFTINGLFYEPARGCIVDFVGGLADIEGRVVRAIGNPAHRFAEDRLRLMRACRFASVLGFTIERATFDAIRAAAADILDVSAERIQDELTRLLTESPRAGQGLLLLRDTGLLAHILPEIAALEGVEQPPEFHPEGDVLTHTVLMLDAMRDPAPALAYAVLFHDAGKATTAEWVATEDGGRRIRFHGHAKAGADIAVNALRRLRCSNDLIDEVSACVLHHMQFVDVKEMRRATLRRMLGRPTFAAELELHRLDCISSHGMLDNHAFLEDALRSMREEKPLPPPWITGDDIMAMGVPEGPDVGRWHRIAYDAQLNGIAGSRDELLAWLSAEVKAAGRPGA